MKRIRIVDAVAKVDEGELVIKGTLENSNDEVEIILSAEVLEAAQKKPAGKDGKK